MRVEDEYRTNPLSLVPGGEEVFVYYGERIRIYDKVKNPLAYGKSLIKLAKERGITKIEIKNEILWES